MSVGKVDLLAQLRTTYCPRECYELVANLRTAAAFALLQLSLTEPNHPATLQLSDALDRVTP